MASYAGKGDPSNGTIYISNLPEGTDDIMLAGYFGTIGLLKKDKRTGRPKIWLYRDKMTNEPKGDATVTYEDPHAALAAVEWFNNKDFHGNIIGVFIAQSKSKDDTVRNSVDDPNDFGGFEENAKDLNEGGGRGRGQDDASGKAWQQDGDWLCPNTSCSNVNFAFRGVCNRCASARPSGPSGGGAGAGGHGRGRGANDSGVPGRSVGAPTGLFGPNDWTCPIQGCVVDEAVMYWIYIKFSWCGNINWAKRLKCNVCNTNKPGHNEGGDDGELYDEFGNLKKKFRAKTQQAEAGKVLPGAGRAGWEVEEFGKHKFLGYIRCKEAMPQLCDLAINVNGQQTFFINQKILSAYSEKLKKIVRREKRKSQIKNSIIEIDDFPGGPDGFELVSRFCYNHGEIKITVSNVALLHFCAVFLGMTENVSTSNLLKQTETFLDGMIYWSWQDTVSCLKSCELFLTNADSSGLVEKLIFSLLGKISYNTDIATLAASSSSSSSSSETASRFRFSSPSKTTPESTKPGSSSKQWWFDDLIILPPMIIEKVIKNMGAYGTDNDSLILTKSLLHFLKMAVLQCKSGAKRAALYSRSAYAGLADTAVHGVISMSCSFSCRGLFSVLRIVSGFGLSKDCRAKLEMLIGGMLDQATLDDLLVSGHDRGVFDVNLVLRLMRIFVHSDLLSSQKLKKVGTLIDKYLCEISPDQNLKASKVLGVAESLPDSARDSFDGVYKAIDIYLEASSDTNVPSHPTLPFAERSRLCRCLNYEKMSLEACKDLAKNPRIPPDVAVEALKLQHSKISKGEYSVRVKDLKGPSMINSSGMVLYNGDVESLSPENQDTRMNMQWRVMELEKACREMRRRMPKLVGHDVNVMRGTTPYYSRSPLPKLC
ncbi:hypothetical protein POTOM_029624 [Populus tomentosa]|uniref:Uncharacterized protein n=1 Tax=Populus tomentosa TaxID=118781 RepID=A0A8X8CJU5_POPTO|nr:hypothetical protein POTOM_029624 [Populus tomentosa]